MKFIEKLITDYPQLAECKEDILKAFDLLRDTIKEGGRIYTCGNGGSASDSQHITAEMMKGFLKKRPVAFPLEIAEKLSVQTSGFLSGKLQGALPCHSLVSETALITALCNDVSADIIFAQQIYGYGKKGDCLIGISTSGYAVNVCLAVELAIAMGLRIIIMTGSDGGKLAQLADKQTCVALIRVPSKTTFKIQEYHLPIYHALCAELEETFFP